MDIELLVNVNLSVDSLHRVREQIKTLEKEEASLKKEILAMKVDEVEGYMCKAVITHVEEGKTTDWKAACKFAGIKQTILDKFSKKKEAYDIVNLRPL